MHGVEWMFSGTGIKPWHGIGEVLEGTLTSEDAIRHAHLDWEVKKEPVYLENGSEIPGYFANIRQDTKAVLGIVGKQYQIVQNADGFQFIDSIMGSDCRYETGGTLFNGKKTFIVTKLSPEKLLDDEVENYLFFTNSHDGLSGIAAGISSIRVVCNNTLQLALANSGNRLWRIKHTGNLQDKQSEAIRALRLTESYQKRRKELVENWAVAKFDVEKFLEAYLSEKTLEFSEKSAKVFTDSFFHLIKKDDLANFRDTKWGIYNAISDIRSNQTPRRQIGKQHKLNRFLTVDPFLKVAEKILLAA